MFYSTIVYLINCKVRLMFESQNDYTWFMEYFEGYFTISEDIQKPVNITLNVYRSRDVYLADSGANEGIQEIIYEQQRVAFYQMDSEIFLYVHLADIGGQSHYVPIRLLRDVIVDRCIDRGFMYLHASAVDYHGRAVIVVGDKFSGKTTSMLCLLESHRYGFLTNDKILFDPHENTLYGLPFSIGVRGGTLEHFPEFSARIQARQQSLKHYQIHSVFENVTQKLEKFFLMPAELSSLENVRLCVRSKLELILCPCYNPDVTEICVVKLQGEPRESTLKNCILKGGVQEELAFSLDIPVYRIDYNENLFVQFNEAICKILK